MGLLDSIKGMFGGKKNEVATPSQPAQTDTMGQVNELVNDVQAVAGGDVSKVGEVVEDVQNVAASVDIPGTDIDDKLRGMVGGNPNEQK